MALLDVLSDRSRLQFRQGKIVNRSVANLKEKEVINVLKENEVVFFACKKELCRLHDVIRNLSLQLHERENYITDLERSLEMKLIDGFD